VVIYSLFIAQYLGSSPRLCAQWGWGQIMVQLILEGAFAGLPHLGPSNQFPNGYRVDQPLTPHTIFATYQKKKKKESNY